MNQKLYEEFLNISRVYDVEKKGFLCDYQTKKMIRHFFKYCPVTQERCRVKRELTVLADELFHEVIMYTNNSLRFSYQTVARVLSHLLSSFL